MTNVTIIMTHTQPSSEGHVQILSQTDCWEMSLIFPPHLISSYWMMSAILCKIFLITMSQFVMGWPAMPGESICDVTSLVTQGDTGRHRGGHRHHHELSRPGTTHDTALVSLLASVRQGSRILLTRSFLNISYNSADQTVQLFKFFPYWERTCHPTSLYRLLYFILRWRYSLKHVLCIQFIFSDSSSGDG